MLILAIADIHGDHSLYKWLVSISIRAAPDAIVLAGDLLGYPEGFKTIEESQRADAIEILNILAPVTKPVLYIMGNDDLVELDSNRDSIQSIHESRYDLDGLSFVGYQYSLPFMGGIFEKSEDGIHEDLNSLDSFVDNHTVFITHSPAYGILDIGVMDISAGSVSIKEFIDRKAPFLHIHGHIHQQFGRQGRHFNVAAAGQRRAVLIDTDTMQHRIVNDSAV